MAKSEKQKTITDVKITNIADIPPKYFMDEGVIEAVRKAVKVDVIKNGVNVPPGAQAIKRNPTVSITTKKFLPKLTDILSRRLQ